MTLTAPEIERATRLLTRTIAKRDAAVTQMDLLNDLAQKIEHSADFLPVFRARKRDINSLLAQFHADQDTILDILIQLKRDSEYQIQHAPIGVVITEQYYSIMASAQEFGVNDPLPSSTVTGNNPDRPHIQLPKIQLPRFDGDILRWISFRDTYVSLVHSNASLSNVEKYHYLLSAVSGSASAVVRSITLSDSNYTIAWQALNERFDNPRLIMNSHLDKLLSFPPLRSSSLDELKLFLDTFQENLAALNSFQVPDKEGFLLFYIASRVLDSNTKCLFEAQRTHTVVPVIGDLLTYVQKRCQVLQNSSVSSTLLPSFNNKPSSGRKNSPSNTRTSLVANLSDSAKLCIICNGAHPLYRCDRFSQQPVAARVQTIQTHRLCRNCLSPGHDASECKSKYLCRHCSAKHHSMLHFENKKSKVTGSSSQGPNTCSSPPSSSVSPSSVLVGTAISSNFTILGTASIRIRSRCGQWISCRALIDSGSQVSAITHQCASALGLSRRRSSIEVAGLSQMPVSQIKGVTTCHFTSWSTTVPEYSCEPIILNKITGLIPSVTLDPVIRAQYSDIQYADPCFDTPGGIDFLLGADVYHQIFLDGCRIRHSPKLPSAFETRLGWIFMGTTSQYITSLPQVSLTLRAEPSIDRLLHRFWEVEEPVLPSTPFTEEQKCEDQFTRTTARDPSGRYIVAFPFKSDPTLLGTSRPMALSRFLNLERKLQDNAELYTAYRSFIDEYIKLGHMTIATSPTKYFIPHHAVVKSANNRFKLRVVFDASARTSSGASLNDILFTGKKLQQDISTLLMSCRFQRYMFTADICKMYRQILMAPDDCQYQHILWRNNPSEPIVEYALTTVTYGVACSPFQAIRVLHQLELDEGSKYPATKNVLSSQTYVDDIITGANSVPLVLSLQKQVRQLLAKGGFDLKKWASNCPGVLQSIPAEDQVMELSFDPKDDAFVKILGLHWDPVVDVFRYHSDPIQIQPTKRAVLSSIAKIYDPLGALAPITFWAKCFMQQLWKEGYSWDQRISEELTSSWILFASELPFVSHIKLQRHIPIQESSDVQLVGFSDASLKGYSAVVYLRLSYISKPTTIHFLTAKSKVAPLTSGRRDENLTVPRLELCGALLLAQVLHRAQQTISPISTVSSVHAWTDSSVVLSWLTSSQVHFKIFVTNRLHKIKELLPACKWHHVPTAQNPADCVSRGMFPEEAVANSLYWEGPPFLLKSIHEWPATNFLPVSPQELPEQAPNPKYVLTNTSTPCDAEWFSRFSTLSRLQRVIAYMRRFADRSRCLPSPNGYLRYTELEQSLRLVVRLTQQHHFHDLHKSFASSSHQALPKSLIRLVPYSDTDGVIRVGGRLRHSEVPDARKHPILLPKSSALSTLLIRHYHIQYLHAGPQLVAALLAHRYWIVSARSLIRQVLFKCVTCTRHRLTTIPPLMADLPPARVRPSRPFSNVGVDYAGPFLIKDGKRKQARSVKCYIALFVCLAVKAVHIEVVSDLTTDAFLAALHRFVSRRGLPHDIYSDCGTNFQGADRELKLLFSTTAAKEMVAGAINCHWHFNPPASPHFGGLWEAAVKSCKYHLKRVVGIQTLTFEEMSTLASRIEAILNSRPITPQSTDPHDLSPLTPGHFLIGSPIVAIPEPDLTSLPINRLRRWQLLSSFHQSFWSRWAAEYLSSLQSRAKWLRPQINIQVGDLVILRSSNLPPCSWKLARVEQIHPGDDGVVRVVTVRTTDGIYKRPVVKLTVMPTSDDH